MLYVAGLHYVHPHTELWKHCITHARPLLVTWLIRHLVQALLSRTAVHFRLRRLFRQVHPVFLPLLLPRQDANPALNLITTQPVAQLLRFSRRQGHLLHLLPTTRRIGIIRSYPRRSCNRCGSLKDVGKPSPRQLVLLLHQLLLLSPSPQPVTAMGENASKTPSPFSLFRILQYPLLPHVHPHLPLLLPIA